jgi:hypothetical protein
MLVSLIQITMLATIAGIVGFRRVPAFQLILAGVLIWIFLMTYVDSNEATAQDRYAYYQWYLVSTIEGIVSERDQVFSYLFSLFPSLMSLRAFSVYFGLLLLLSIAILYLILHRTFGRRLGFVTLALVVLLLDRFSIGMIFNTSRSFLAGALFCVVFAKKTIPLPARLGFVALALGVHLPVSSAMLALYVVALFFRRIRILKIVAMSGACVFAVKYLIGFALFDLTMINLSSVVYEESRFSRIEGTGGDVATLSLLLQISVAILIPVLLIVFRPREDTLVEQPQGNIFRVLEDDMLTTRFALLCAIALFLFYPEVLLAQRIGIGMTIVFPFLVRERDLVYLAVAKSILFIAIYPNLVTI